MKQVFACGFLALLVPAYAGAITNFCRYSEKPVIAAKEPRDALI